MAPRDVKAGALYADAIVRAITACEAFVLVLSASAIASSHVGKEVERASSKKRTIFTLRIDDSPLTPALEYFLSESQWIEARCDNKEAGYARLIAALRGPQAAGLRTGAAAIAPLAETRSSNRVRKTILLLFAVFAIVLSALFIGRFRFARHGGAGQTTIASSAVATDKSIAVLPFTDLSEKKDQKYFADGMAEEVIDLLTKIPGLRVIGRTSSFQFKTSGEDLRGIGARLGAAYLVEGSVRRSPGRVRVTAQLIETSDGAHRWSDTYDRPANDVLQVQDEIAAGITRALQVSLGADRPESKRSSKSVDAYDLYLRGLNAMDRNDDDGFAAAVVLLRQAVELDPNSAESSVALAETYYWQANNSLVPSGIGYPQARSAAQGALKLDDSLGLAHAILGAIHTEYDRDWTAAEQEFQLALSLAPRDGLVVWLAAQLPFALGHDDVARAMYKKSLVYDPLLATSYLNLSWVECRSGRLNEAEAAARKVLEIDPSFVWGHVFLGYPLLLKGDKVAALSEMEEERDPKGHIDGLALVYHALGRKGEADEALHKLTVEHADQSAFYIAEAHAYRGEPDEALTWLDRAYAQKEPTLFLIKGDPFFRNLVDDPRYQSFLRKIKVLD